MFALYFFILGAIWGSFINVCAYRIPKKLSLIFTRSRCTSCSHPLLIIDLIPLLSYLFLKGCCRHCKTTISIQYPIIELIFACSALFLYPFISFNIHCLLIWIMYSLLWIITIIDLKTMYIYNNCLFLLLVCGLLNYFIQPQDFIIKALSSLLISIPLLILSKTTTIIGSGDAYFLGIIAFILGFNKTLLAFFFGSIFGGIVALFLILLKHKKRKDYIPFIPFLFLGILLSYVYGDIIIDSYLRLLV